LKNYCWLSILIPLTQSSPGKPPDGCRKETSAPLRLLRLRLLRLLLLLLLLSLLVAF
jgi:hypothetical protein